MDAHPPEHTTRPRSASGARNLEGLGGQRGRSATYSGLPAPVGITSSKSPREVKGGRSSASESPSVSRVKWAGLTRGSSKTAFSGGDEQGSPRRDHSSLSAPGSPSTDSPRKASAALPVVGIERATPTELLEMVAIPAVSGPGYRSQFLYALPYIVEPEIFLGRVLRECSQGEARWGEVLDVWVQEHFYHFESSPAMMETLMRYLTSDKVRDRMRVSDLYDVVERHVNAFCNLPSFVRTEEDAQFLRVVLQPYVDRKDLPRSISREDALATLNNSAKLIRLISEADAADVANALPESSAGQLERRAFQVGKAAKKLLDRFVRGGLLIVAERGTAPVAPSPVPGTTDNPSPVPGATDEPSPVPGTTDDGAAEVDPLDATMVPAATEDSMSSPAMDASQKSTTITTTTEHGSLSPSVITSPKTPSSISPASTLRKLDSGGDDTKDPVVYTLSAMAVAIYYELVREDAKFAERLAWKTLLKSIVGGVGLKEHTDPVSGKKFGICLSGAAMVEWLAQNKDKLSTDLQDLPPNHLCTKLLSHQLIADTLASPQGGPGAFSASHFYSIAGGNHTDLTGRQSPLDAGDLGGGGGESVTKLESLLDHSVEGLGDALTHIDLGLCRNVNLSELDFTRWKKQLDGSVQRWIGSFNRTCYLVATEILTCPWPEDRLALLLKFIDVAWYLKDIGNFHSLFAVMGGLNLNALKRVTDLWAKLPAKQLERYSWLNTFTSSAQNFKEYRTALKNAPSAVIPYAGLLLQDILSLEEIPLFVKDTDGVQLLNFERLRKFAAVKAAFLQMRQNGFSAPPCEQSLLRYLLHDGLELDSQILYKLSLKLQSRTATTQPKRK